MAETDQTPDANRNPTSSWEDLPDDFFLSTSLSSPPPPVPSTSPRAHRSTSLPTTTTFPSASFSAALLSRPPPPPLHPRHSLPVFSSSAADAPEAGDHWPPPPGPHHSSSLPEFVSACSGSSIHCPPPRAAVRPDRPPPLELRPRPPRESQAGAALRAVACVGSHLWAAGEAGVRVWDLDDVFRPPSGEPRRWGDEASAPFRESRRTPPAVCLTADPGRGVVWSGHSDGRIMAWRMAPDPVLGECLAWDAHHGSVLAVAVTRYGELWSGSEGGVIRVWCIEAIEKSLSLPREEKRKASFLVKRSCIDLRGMVCDGGMSPLPAVDVKLLLSDNSRSKVWSGGYVSLALWDSCSKKLLKVINADGQIDTRFDILTAQDQYGYDAKQNLFSFPNKDKSRGPVSFFQRSRNALMGAADAVRRVAAKAGFGDDTRRLEALSMSMDGMIWTGSANGSLGQWDGSGYRLQEFQHHSSSVQCICSFGTRLWVGYMDGTVQLLDLEGNMLGGWIAHSNPILNMAVGSSYIFTLASHGGIRGWNLSSPGPIDSDVRSELIQEETSYKKFEYVKVLVGSWNVGQERASYESLKAWLKFPTLEIGLVVVGLQEVDMGAGFLAMSAAKETVGLEGSPNGEWWLEEIGQILKGSSFERVGSRQMAGLLIAVWARTNIKEFIGDIDGAAVACGLGRALGNKGAVALRIRIHSRSICFVNCHFAAHMEAVSRRNEDFDHVFRTMTFSSASSALLTTSVAGSAVQLFRGADGLKKPDLSEIDMVVFLGDLNYRLYDISYDDAMRLVSQRCFDWLREKDQLRAEMRAGRVFQGLREGHFIFPPTYKFEKYIAGLTGYDCSEKKRIPAWCDRILYRDSRANSESESSLDCPVVSSVSLYDSCMEAVDSDHKPIKCVFNLDIAYVDKQAMRQKYGEIVGSSKKVWYLLEGLQVVPEFTVSMNSFVLQDQDTTILRVANISTKDAACFEIIGHDPLLINNSEQAGNSHGLCFSGFPIWLKVSPAVGIIYAGQTVEITLQHGDLCSQDFLNGNWRNNSSGDGQEKIAMLEVRITGIYSTTWKGYRVRVQHHTSRKALASRSLNCR